MYISSCVKADRGGSRSRHDQHHKHKLHVLKRNYDFHFPVVTTDYPHSLRLPDARSLLLKSHNDSHFVCFKSSASTTNSRQANDSSSLTRIQRPLCNKSRSRRSFYISLSFPTRIDPLTILPVVLLVPLSPLGDLPCFLNTCMF